MRDTNLINALRCVSTAVGPMGDCEKCLFYKTEPVPEDLAGKVNLTEWSSCDVDAVGFAAADRIANQSTHIAALQQEIEKLRAQLRHLCQNCDLDRLEKLAEADRAGRLVVLPCKTRQQELLEQYPTADADESGVLEVCPALLFASHRGKKGGCSTPNRSCDDCRKEFWSLWAEAALESKKDE